MRLAAAAPNQQSADAATTIADLGGNAVDAGIAATLVAMVNEPGIVSLGGAGFVTVGTPASRPVTIDGNVAMPTVTPETASTNGSFDVTLPYGGGVTTGIGHGSVAIPGTPAALGHAHDLFGSLPWSVVCEPAISVAAQGFTVGTAAGYYIGLIHDIMYGQLPESRQAVHHHDGRTPYAAGDHMHVTGQADAFSWLACAGWRDFYTGQIAEIVVKDMHDNGGYITAKDLSSYQPIVRDSLQVTAGEWEISTNPAPSIGGPVLAALIILSMGNEAPEQHIIQHRVLSYRRDVLDISRDRVKAVGKLLDGIGGDGATWLSGPPSTVHISTMDEKGMACSITASSGYGSGVPIKGAGIFLNNALGEPELNRGGRYVWDVGSRLPSNMAPTVATHRDGSRLAIGSPGADRITTALAQTFVALAGGASLIEAIAAPRLHVRPGASESDVPTIEVEPGIDLPDTAWSVNRWPHRDMYFGGVGAARRDSRGVLHAAADPRRDGGVHEP